MKVGIKIVLVILVMSMFLLTSCEPPVGEGNNNSTNQDADGDGDADPDPNPDPNPEPNPGTGLDVINLSSTISSDVTWFAGKVYYASGDVNIEATVTIEPGCIIKVNKKDTRRGTIRVNTGGKILAVGTAAKPIYFTSRDDDSLGGKHKDSRSNPSVNGWDAVKITSIHTSSDSVFKYCTFKYAEDGLEVSNELHTITVTDNVFTNNEYGFCARYGLTNSTIERNRFFLNTYPIIIEPTLNIGTSNYFTSEDGSLMNTKQYITFYTWGGAQIKSSVTFEETDVPFYGSLVGMEIGYGSTLTLKPGVAIIMPTDSIISISKDSNLVMETGSVITSNKDESLAGTTTVAADDYWRGIRKQNPTGSGYSWMTDMPNVFFSTESSIK